MKNKAFNKRGMALPSIILISIFIVTLLAGAFTYYFLYAKPLGEQGFSCGNDNECDDNNLCTKDTCSPRTGICYNVKKTCPAGQRCDVPTGDCVSTDEIPPSFTNLNNQIIYNNQSLYYDIDATDAQSGLESFTINWTTQFSIVPSTGVLTNISALAVRDYYIDISVKDKSENVNSEILLVRVIDSSSQSPPPPISPPSILDQIEDAINDKL